MRLGLDVAFGRRFVCLSVHMHCLARGLTYTRESRLTASPSEEQRGLKFSISEVGLTAWKESFARFGMDFMYNVRR